MGLFEFVKDAGEAILKGDQPEAEKPANVQDYIKKALGGKVKDLAVDMVGDMIKLKGDAENEEILEKAILMAGNIAGVGKVETDELKVGGAAGGQGLGSGGGGQSEFYTIVKGD
ncbi:MAG: BON domain-containing protein, partial [Deltaproteobacteria bacterium]|nr:BON domain-containing protein [Deltaproteobacteria bacterium]